MRKFNNLILRYLILFQINGIDLNWIFKCWLFHWSGPKFTFNECRNRERGGRGLIFGHLQYGLVKVYLKPGADLSRYCSVLVFWHLITIAPIPAALKLFVEKFFNYWNFPWFFTKCPTVFQSRNANLETNVFWTAKLY